MDKKLFDSIQKHKKEQETLDAKKQIITSKILEEATSILETFKDFNIEAYKSFIESLGVVTEVKKDNTKEEIIKLTEENKALKAKIASLEVMIKALNNTKKETINKGENNEDKEKNKEDIKESKKKEKVEETQKRKKTRRSKRKENGEDQSKDRTLIELPETLKINFSNLYSYKCEAVDEKERYIRGYYQDVPFPIGIKNSSVMVYDINNQDMADEIYNELRKVGLVEKKSVCTDPFRTTAPYGVVELATNDTYIGFVIDHNNYITLFTYQERNSKKVACCGLPSFMESKDLFHNCHDKEVNELAFQLINQHRSSMGLPLIDNTKEETKENNTKEEINNEDTKEQENTKDEIIEETNDNITEETNDEEEWNEEDEWEDWEADEMLRQQVAQSAEEYYKRRADKMEYEEQNEEF